MKKLAFIISALATPLLSTAQSHWYLAPSLNTGMANVRQNEALKLSSGAGLTKCNVLSYGFGVGFGYKVGNWRLESGVAYFNTGYKDKGYIFETQFDPSSPTGYTGIVGSVKTDYQHIGIPLNVAYDFRISDRFSFAPKIGVMTSYNFGGTYHNNFDSSVGSTAKQSGRIDKGYSPLALWGTISLPVQYKIGERIGLFAGPSAMYMVTNFLNTDNGNPLGIAQHNCLLTGTAGINICL